MENGVKIALAFEGPAEIQTAEIFLTRLFDPLPIIIVDSVFPHTGLIGYIPTYLSRFSETDANIYIFFTDLDGDSKRGKQIKKIMEQYPEFSQRTVFALSNPHFESWLIADQDIAKQVFGLPGEIPLPHESHLPKRRLELLRRDMKEGEQKTIHDIRTELASQVNIEVLQRVCPDFKKFNDELKTAVTIL